ncbi:MAG: DNA-binding transcriptional regulator [Ignavibacteriaceae bacterium]
MKRIVLLVETSRAFGRGLIMGIARYSKIYGPWSFYKEPIDLKSSIPHLTGWKPDGIIMRDSLVTKELLNLKIPTILAIHDSSYPKNLPVIKTDSQSIAKLASDHLIEKGLKNFAFFGFDNYDWLKERRFYFSRFNTEAGYYTHIYIPRKKIKKDEWEREQQEVSDWVNALPKPVGVFACNDDHGQHILEVCKLINLKVPEDVAVIGVDNDPMICDISDPPLTSIALNVEAAGYEAAKLMDNMIDSQTLTGRQVIVSPSYIVQRQSTDILAVKDNNVSKAMQFIKKNAKNKISVEDVVKATNVNRRVLERRFKTAIHRSIYDEIQNIRVELIAKLLIETDLSISQITSYFNFTDAEHISRYFKRKKGMGLRGFRKCHKPGYFS